MTHTVRPAVHADAEAFAALAAAIEADRPTNFQLSADEFREFNATPEAELEVVEAADGALLAWGGYLWRAPHEHGQALVVLAEVHPEHTGRGLERELLTRSVARARARHDDDAPGLPLTLVHRVASTRDEALGLARDLGFVSDRYRFAMVADLAATGELPAGLPPALEADYELVTVDPADAELLRAANNAAFADYPNHTPMTEEAWASFMVDAAHVRPELSFWCRDRSDGSPAACVFMHEFAVPVSGILEGRETYVPYLGTLPAHRGRGLAGTLLRISMRASRDAGYARTALDVDAENPTGALGMYERAGFTVRARFDEMLLRE